MGKTAGVKEASFVEGKLVRIVNSRVEFLSKDKTGEPSLLRVRLGEGVNIDLDSVGEEVKAVIVDGRVAKITRLPPKLPRETSPGTVSCFQLWRARNRLDRLTSAS